MQSKKYYLVITFKTKEGPYLKPSLRQKIWVKLTGRCFLRMETHEGWTGYLPVYIVYCKKHRLYFTDYQHGYDSHFTCPRCEP